MIASARERLAIGRAPRAPRDHRHRGRSRRHRARALGGRPAGRPLRDRVPRGARGRRGRARAPRMIFFDVDDARAAQREAWARWAAIDPAAAPWVGAAGASCIDAWNDRDRARVRAPLRRRPRRRGSPADRHRPDRRRRRLRRQHRRALWELAPDQRIEVGWSWPAVEPPRRGHRVRRSGTLPDGGAFESEYLWLFIVAARPHHAPRAVRARRPRRGAGALRGAAPRSAAHPAERGDARVTLRFAELSAASAQPWIR